MATSPQIIGYVTNLELSLLKQGASVVDLFHSPTSDHPSIPLYADPAADTWRDIKTAPPGMRLQLWWTPVTSNPAAEAAVFGALNDHHPETYWSDDGRYVSLSHITHWRFPPTPPRERAINLDRQERRQVAWVDFVEEISQENARLREALIWYSDVVRVAANVGDAGDFAHDELMIDGGSRADAALSNNPEAGRPALTQEGDKTSGHVDNGDGG